MIRNTKYKLGFTLIELLVTTSIILLLAGFGLASWQTFNEQQTLDAAAQDLKNNLRQVRSWAMAVRKANCSGETAGYEVNFNNVDNGYRIIEKCGSGNYVLQTFYYPAGVSDNNYNGSFVFAPLTGATNLSAETTITLSLGSRKKTITIRKNGEIEIE
ncbi:prepilin-type N-terminal cleavage/methylation domain-containing protein [Candidatus Shapirobacteria bacterium]|nr:prepilin-type N-terminal cleavage/methylation domain-containing protein [Candidatus Shapirobacteria bacterium]